MPPNQGLELPAPTLGGPKSAPAPAPEEARPARRGGGVKRAVIFLLLAGLVVFIGFRVVQGRKAAAEKENAGPKGGGMAVPVVVGTVATKAVPIYLDGLGTIQPLQTVTVRARVEGAIEKIAFQEGQEVKEGDLLVQLDAAPFQTALDQAKAQLRQNEVLLANAQRDLARATQLAGKQVVSKQEFDTQRTTTGQLEAGVRNSQAAVASAEVQLGYTRITSPLTGRTGLRQVDEGNLVQANSPNGIVTITQIQPIALLFTLPEQYLPQIQKAQGTGSELKVQAVARDNVTVLGEGKLTVIDNQIDTTTGTIRLKAAFPNADKQLWPGQFVNARLLVATRENGVVVPASVIQRGPEGAFAYLVKEGKAEMRPVKVAQTDGGQALIDSGLSPGEQVVIDGQFKLQPGSPVKPAESAGRPGGPNPKSSDTPNRQGSKPVPAREGATEAKP